MNEDDSTSPRRRHEHAGAGGTVFLSIVVSMVTSAALFFGLRELDHRGALGGQAAPAVPVEVPNVVGMTANQAREILQGRGLLLSLDEQRASARVPVGAIVEQIPLAGSQIEPKKAVRAVVSLGPLAIPSVAGLTADAAAMKLQQAGFVVGPRRDTPDDKVAVGTVIDTDPPAAAPQDKGATVALIVSSGPSGKAVPKLLGLRLSAAKKAITDAGFTVGSTRIGYSENRDPGVVLTQTPEAGQMAAPASKVDVVINEPDE